MKCLLSALVFVSALSLSLEIKRKKKSYLQHMHKAHYVDIGIFIHYYFALLSTLLGVVFACER